MREDIRLYCGLSEYNWSGVPVEPGPYVCVSPVSGRSQESKRETCLTVPDGVKVIQDSGAFSDSWSERLSFAKAMDRQIAHAEKYDYSDQILYRASYDLLIDEVWSDGNRTKRRWSVAAAESAVDETVKAAAWLNDHRSGIPLAISAQSVDAAQYLRCVERLLPYFQPGDILGFGGWCIIGKMPRQMLQAFHETVDLVIPFLAQEGIPAIHLWGVIFPPALAYLLLAARKHSIAISTDSAMVSLNPVYGNWGYGSWRNNKYQRPEGEQLGRDRVRHASITREWLGIYSDTIDFERVTFCRDGNVPLRSRRSGLTFQNSDHWPESVTLPSCAICGREMVKRSHAKTCSARCRKALSRL